MKKRFQRVGKIRVLEGEKIIGFDGGKKGSVKNKRIQ